MDLIALLSAQLPSFHIDVFRGQLTATAKGFFTSDNPAPRVPHNAMALIDAFNETFRDWDQRATEYAARHLDRIEVASRFPLVCCTGEGGRCFFQRGETIYAMAHNAEGHPDVLGDDANPIDALDDVWLSATTELGIRFLISVTRTFGPQSRHAQLIKARVAELIWEDLPEMDHRANGAG